MSRWDKLLDSATFAVESGRAGRFRHARLYISCDTF